MLKKNRSLRLAWLPAVLSLVTMLALFGCGAEPVQPEDRPPVETPPQPADGATADLSEGPFDETAWLGKIEEWQAGRMKRTGSETGWLTVVGLYWFSEGENSFGADSTNKIVLEGDGVPKNAGVFELDGDRVTITGKNGAGLLLNDEPMAAPAELKPDTTGKPDKVKLGDLTMYVLERGGRYGLRVKNSKSPALAEFAGLDYYPTSTRYRIDAEFVPYDEPKIVKIPTVLGTYEPMPAPGLVRFTIDGEEVTLQPVAEEDDEQLWFIFKDATSSDETYPAGRFLYTDLPVNGRVTIDFNRAYNPPCAFTPFATCPLPPKQNIMTMRIEAGEKNYELH